MAEEVGPKVAEAVVQYFSEPGNRELVDRLRKAGLQFTYVSTRPKEAGPLQGKTLVHHRNAAHLEPRRRQAVDRAGRRQGLQRGEQEDQLRRGG